MSKNGCSDLFYNALWRYRNNDKGTALDIETDLDYEMELGGHTSGFTFCNLNYCYRLVISE
jgi:hypothetical protein